MRASDTVKYFFGTVGWIMGHASNSWWGMAGFLTGFIIYDLLSWAVKRI